MQGRGRIPVSDLQAVPPALGNHAAIPPSKAVSTSAHGRGEQAAGGVCGLVVAAAVLWFFFLGGKDKLHLGGGPLGLTPVPEVELALGDVPLSAMTAELRRQWEDFGISFS